MVIKERLRLWKVASPTTDSCIWDEVRQELFRATSQSEKWKDWYLKGSGNTSLHLSFFLLIQNTVCWLDFLTVQLNRFLLPFQKLPVWIRRSFILPFSDSTIYLRARIDLLTRSSLNVTASIKTVVGSQIRTLVSVLTLDFFPGRLCLVGPEDRPGVWGTDRCSGQTLWLGPDPGAGWWGKCKWWNTVFLLLFFNVPLLWNRAPSDFILLTVV